MTKHKAGETKDERNARRIIEHNRKVIREHYHLDETKYIEQNAKRIGDFAKRVVSKFSDKDMEEAGKLGMMIVQSSEPEEGYDYVEAAYYLWGNHTLWSDKKEEYDKFSTKEFIDGMRKAGIQQQKRRV